jgi:hypothetical protein
LYLVPNKTFGFDGRETKLDPDLELDSEQDQEHFLKLDPDQIKILDHDPDLRQTVRSAHFSFEELHK